MIKQQTAGSPFEFAAGIGIGTGISLIVTLILTAISAWLVSGEYLPEDSSDWLIVGIHSISTVVGAWVAYSVMKKKRLIVCLGTAAGYCLLMLATTALFFDGQYADVGISVAIILISGLAVGLLGLKEKKRSAVSRRNMKNR